MAELVISIVTSIVTSAVSKIGALLVETTIREGRYLLFGAKITKKFESAKEEMMKTQKEVHKLVEDLPEVGIADDAIVKWLDDVKNLITEVEKLEEEIKAKGSCFRGCCLHGLYKQMSKKTETMIKLSMDGKFDRVSKPTRYPSTGKFMKFKSTELAFHKFMVSSPIDDSDYEEDQNEEEVEEEKEEEENEEEDDEKKMIMKRKKMKKKKITLTIIVGEHSDNKNDKEDGKV